jgi:hypothetical protein
VIVFILVLLTSASIGLGFALRKQAPKLHIIMCLLISFLVVLMFFTGIAVALGKLGP